MLDTNIRSVRSQENRQAARRSARGQPLCTRKLHMESWVWKTVCSFPHCICIAQRKRGVAVLSYSTRVSFFFSSSSPSHRVEPQIGCRAHSAADAPCRNIQRRVYAANVIFVNTCRHKPTKKKTVHTNHHARPLEEITPFVKGLDGPENLSRSQLNILLYVVGRLRRLADCRLEIRKQYVKPNSFGDFCGIILACTGIHSCANGMRRCSVGYSWGSHYDGLIVTISTQLR